MTTSSTFAPLLLYQALHLSLTFPVPLTLFIDFLFHFCHPTLSAPFFPLPALAVPFFLVLFFFHSCLLSVARLLFFFSLTYSSTSSYPCLSLSSLIFCSVCLFCSSLPFLFLIFLSFLLVTSLLPPPHVFPPLSSLVALVTQLYKTIYKASQCCELDP